MREQYRQRDKEVKRSVREDKRKWMTEKAQVAQTAAENGRTKEQYDITRQLSGRGPRKTAAITNKDGKLLKSKEGRLTRWKEHFEAVLNREGLPNPLTDEEMGEEELDIDTEPPTEEEIKRVVQTLKNGKAPGINQITAELLKVDTESTCMELMCLFDLIWQEEKLPEQWKQVPKGNLQQCGNWRGVTLLPIASKVLGKILISRIQGCVDHRLRKEQAGFRPGRGTVKQICILCNILEQVNEWNATMYFHFVNFEKAFDLVHRDSLWRIMRAYGIPDKLIGLVKVLYDGFTCAVINEGEIMERFLVVTGVKQGCCMSVIGQWSLTG